MQNNSYLNEGIIYRIKQNKNLVKTSQYYYIDYQYIVKENEESADVKEFQTKRRLASEESKYYYGRINRLKFKLCHKYCEKCYELSVLDEAQKCTSCLPENQYNYLTFTNDNDYQENEINCVPEGFYFVRDRNVLASCKEPNNNYYYINIIDNKNICFDKNYGCPEEFPILDDETKECFNCDLTHYTNNKCTMAQFKEKSCTECNFDCYTLEACNFDEFDTTNDDFYDSIKSGGFISKYDGEHGDLKISNGDGYTFQITTVENELNGLKDNSQSEFSIIDLKECAELLKRENGLDPDVDLVILKYENTDSVSNGNEKSIQYEVYPPNSDQKLDLSICDETTIDIYVPIESDEKTQKLYESLKEQGYDLFDKNDKFYTDICTPYTSPDGTDVILSDRLSDIYDNNKLQCQNNCEYSSYLPTSKYLKCQ